jgi:membrane-bound lytic murein transglycosylase B
MNRRAFVFSTAGLAAIPNPSVWGGSLLPVALDPLAPSGDFDVWRRAFVDRAASAGFPRDRVGSELATLTSDPKVIQADQRQPELSRPIGDYMAGAVSDARIQRGRGYRADLAPVLDRIADRTGLAPEILLAIWAVESNFGQNQGGFDVVRSLATLAAEGRRRDWAERQLMASLRIIFSGEAPRDRLKGSWAGAMGQTQFTPEDYLAWAVDEDGDGRRDIWGSSADALGSAANFLAHKAAWRRGEAWAREAVLPQAGFDYSLAEGPFQPWSAWAAMGVRVADGQPWGEREASEAMGLILPAGYTGPAFMILPNHMAIRAYNNSTTYALAVGLLADRIAGTPALIQAWPADQPLSLADRMGAQVALTRLGFDAGEPDGVMGLKTRAAARAWQKARGLPADGYLSYRLIQTLKIQAGLTDATTPTL